MKTIKHITQEASPEPNFGILTGVKEASFHELIYVFHQMKKGDCLTLLHERSNPVNPWAVEVYFRGFKIGYLPETTGKITARLIDRGVSVSAFLRNTPDPSHLFQAIELELRAFIPGEQPLEKAV